MAFNCTLCGEEIAGRDLGVDGSENYNFGLVCKKHNQADIRKVNDLTTEYCEAQIREEFASKLRRKAEEFYDGLLNDE